MKKSYRFVILACVAVMLTSCVGKLGTDKIAVDIQFRPVIGYDTRANESVPFPEDRSFVLWAQAPQLDQMYIDAETISYNGSWKSAKTWPEHQIEFQACWPQDLQILYSKTKGLQISDFDCSGGDIDILLAKADSKSEIDGRVVLPFNHALSRVEFRLRHSLSEEMSVRINKIVLKGYAQKGNYNIKESNAWKCEDYSASRVIFAAPENQPVPVPSGETLYFGSEFFTIPQVSTPMLELFYEVRYSEANWIPQVSRIEYMEMFWEPGKHYTYTLNLGMEKLGYTTGISSWNNRE